MKNKTFLPILLITLFLLPSYAAQSGSVLQKDDQALQRKYVKAVRDAEVCEPGEISKNLTAITPVNKDLIWKEGQQEKCVLVVTWTDWNGYDSKVGQTVDAQKDIWVTAAPELQKFIKRHRYTGQDMELRIRQLLGLSLESNKTKFVEIWVSPKYLFRPSPDPEITDCEAELDFPSNRFVTICDDYKNWFNTQKSASYRIEGNPWQGFPWTRLGYTYDWGNPTSEVGLSEFVISVGAKIEICSVRKNEEYFRYARQHTVE